MWVYNTRVKSFFSHNQIQIIYTFTLLSSSSYVFIDIYKFKDTFTSDINKSMWAYAHAIYRYTYVKKYLRN